jgi:hypothetical protein
MPWTLNYRRKVRIVSFKLEINLKMSQTALELDFYRNKLVVIFKEGHKIKHSQV